MRMTSAGRYYRCQTNVGKLRPRFRAVDDRRAESGKILFQNRQTLAVQQSAEVQQRILQLGLLRLFLCRLLCGLLLCRYLRGLLLRRLLSRLLRCELLCRSLLRQLRLLLLLLPRSFRGGFAPGSHYCCLCASLRLFCFCLRFRIAFSGGYVDADKEGSTRDFAIA